MAATCGRSSAGVALAACRKYFKKLHGVHGVCMCRRGRGQAISAHRRQLKVWCRGMLGGGVPAYSFGDCSKKGDPSRSWRKGNQRLQYFQASREDRRRFIIRAHVLSIYVLNKYRRRLHLFIRRGNESARKKYNASTPSRATALNRGQLFGANLRIIASLRHLGSKKRLRARMLAAAEAFRRQQITAC